MSRLARHSEVNSQHVVQETQRLHPYKLIMSWKEAANPVLMLLESVGLLFSKMQIQSIRWERVELCIIGVVH